MVGRLAGRPIGCSSFQLLYIGKWSIGWPNRSTSWDKRSTSWLIGEHCLSGTVSGLVQSSCYATDKVDFMVLLQLIEACFGGLLCD